MAHKTAPAMASSQRPSDAPAAIEADFEALSAASKAAVDLHAARDIAAERLNISSLTRPFDFEFLEACCKMSSPAIPQVTYDNLTAVPRAYEEQYLLEPGPNERVCRFGTECEGMHLRNGFILKEFILPGQSPTPQRRPCLLCHRKIIASAYYTSLAQSCRDSPSSHTTLSSYYNLVDVPGEYTLADMLCSSGLQSSLLPLPVVKHMRCAYDVVRERGQKRIQQTLYHKPEETGPPAFFQRGVSDSNSAT